MSLTYELLKTCTTIVELFDVNELFPGSVKLDFLTIFILLERLILIFLFETI